MLSPGGLSSISPRKATAERDKILTNLLLCWNLKIDVPEAEQSPLKRSLPTSKAKDFAGEAFFKINYLSLKDEAALSSAIRAFEDEAGQLQSGWLYKSHADADLFPRSRSVARPVRTTADQKELFQCLLRFINPAFEKVKEHERRKKWMLLDSTSSNGISVSVVTPQSTSFAEDLDDTAIPFSFSQRSAGKSNGKRCSDGISSINDDFKRAKFPPDESPSKMIIDGVDSIPVTVHSGLSHACSSFLQQPLQQDPNQSAPGNTFKAPLIPRRSFTSIANASFISDPNIGFTSNANTSFTSNLSSVFSRESSEESDDSFRTTHTTLADVSFDRKMTLEPNSPMETDDMDESVYGSTFDVTELEDKIQTSAEDSLHERLQHVFPSLPATLEGAPLPIKYEVTRVCSYAKIPMTEIEFQDANWSNLRKYDELWDYLKNHRQLKHRKLPERSERIPWTASLGTYSCGFDGVSLSAKATFNKTKEGPFFNVQLQPLKIENSHRLGRRFGNDRFFEMSLPDFYGNKIPNFLKLADESGHGDVCRKIIVEWIIRQEHRFLGRSWRAFFLKGVRPRKKKLQLSSEELNNIESNSIYFFATDGIGFDKSDHISPKGEIPTKRTKMTVNALLNWLIPFEQNLEEKVLKLFSRISLGLSRSWNTVELEPYQIRYPPDLRSADGKEIMNDGCGRLSMKMAADVANCLGLTYVPCGFQARFGSAKGLWIVDVNDSTNQIWIELYPSQIKWNIDIHNITHGERDHRTFEVLNWVKPLKSASLNLQFLSILEDRAEDRAAMRNAISALLDNGLRYEINKQRAAMDSPLLFRKWVQDNSGFEERLKHSKIQYKAGLPYSIEEQINLLLDNGFDPKRLPFLKELARKAFKKKCDILRRKLNITVGCSTYAYMAVDFAGILKPNEVHLGFSTNFKDEQSGFDEVILDGMDILVARCPAHFVSDIQRVKAVWKRELKSLKDVVVFSSQGDYPLAKKLSGGDYDGDIAWVCFEPTIVDRFRNAKIPLSQDLIHLGYIRKDQSGYSELVAKHTDPIPEFLQYSFEFNLRKNLLGLCTSFKERYCYTVNTVSNDGAVFLSSLLSDLVDQHKQGHIFTQESWSDIKDNIIKTKVKEPAYVRDSYEGNNKFQHIIDYLKFIVAENTVDNALETFHQGLEAAQYLDEDLETLSIWARERTKESAEWKLLLDKLKEDITALKLKWSNHFIKRKDPESATNFVPLATDFYLQWQAIEPAIDTPLSQALAPSCLPCQDNSFWSLLKASLGFSLSLNNNKTYMGNFIWWMAGKQLAYLKALFSKSVTSMTPEMYAVLKPNPTFVKLLHSEEHKPIFWEAKAESVVLDEEEMMEE